MRNLFFTLTYRLNTNEDIQPIYFLMIKKNTPTSPQLLRFDYVFCISVRTGLFFLVNMYVSKTSMWESISEVNFVLSRDGKV